MGTIFLILLSLLPIAGCMIEQYPDCGFELSERRLSPPVHMQAAGIELFVLPERPTRACDTVAIIKHCRNDGMLTPANREVHDQARSSASDLGGDAVLLEYRHSVSVGSDGKPKDSYSVRGTVLLWR